MALKTVFNPFTGNLDYVGSPTSATTRSWQFVGSMIQARGNYGIAKLDNGKVLIAGGDATMGGAAYKTCELFDPSTNTWAATGSMFRARSWFHLVKLASGNVLAIGGTSDGGTTFHTTCEIYDVTAGTWSDTGALTFSRIQFCSWILSNGKVLVAGGHHGSGTDTNTCELYTPGTGLWAATGALSGNAVVPTGGPFTYSPRWGLHCVLGDGRPLIIGGTINNGAQASKNVQVYSIAGGTWSALANAPDYISGIEANQCVTTLDGNALIVGSDFDQAPNIRATCYIFDQTLNTMSATGDLPVATEGCMVWVRADGTVLQAGGSADQGTVAMSESAIFSGSTWTAISPLNTKRKWLAIKGGSGVILDDGRCLIAGGQRDGDYVGLATCETLVSSTDSFVVYNGTTDKTYDATNTSLDEVANVLASLISDLQDSGIIS